MINLSHAVEESRKAVGWTVRDLADRAGVSIGTVSAVINGDRGITMGTAHRIAEAFGVKLADLISLAEDLESKDQERARIELEMRKLALMLVNRPELFQTDKDPEKKKMVTVHIGKKTKSPPIPRRRLAKPTAAPAQRFIAVSGIAGIKKGTGVKAKQHA
jgi:transcriptional regulator with XRE-family HTH domain